MSLREQLEATKKELAAAEAAAAQAPALEAAVATLQERVRALEAELAIRCAALAQAQAALADARKTLAEREAEASSLRAQAAAAVAVAVRPTPAPAPSTPLPSAPSLAGSARCDALPFALSKKTGLPCGPSHTQTVPPPKFWSCQSLTPHGHRACILSSAPRGWANNFGGTFLLLSYGLLGVAKLHWPADCPLQDRPYHHFPVLLLSLESPPDFHVCDDSLANLHGTSVRSMTCVSTRAHRLLPNSVVCMQHDDCGGLGEHCERSLTGFAAFISPSIAARLDDLVEPVEEGSGCAP
jgi:hypothetical protein